MKRSWSLPDFSWNLVWQKGEKDREAGDHLSLCRQNRRVDQRLKEEKNRESICGRLLLLRGLQELGYDRLFPENKNPEQQLETLAASLEKVLTASLTWQRIRNSTLISAIPGMGSLALWLPCPAGWTFRKDVP